MPAYRRQENQNQMKTGKIVRVMTCAVVAWILTLSFACGNSHSHSHDGTNTEQAEQGKEYTSHYICPMHCEGSGSHEAGTCPACGMDYVVNKDFKED